MSPGTADLPFCRKGLLPCLITYAVMDFLVIPPLKRRWDR